MPPKSIFRQPGAQHFQLVHRSQRDPLIHDPEASQHVLKAFVPENQKKGKSRAELESLLSPSELAHDASRSNIGEASLYGVYYDDTDYDYMQHLRNVGIQEEGVDSVLIEAPAAPKSHSREKAKTYISLRDLPAESLPSTSERPWNVESQQAIPSSIAGFQPDMDPHLRQVLDALEDEAYVDEGLEDDFFEDLIQNGERAPNERFDYDFVEDGVSEEAETATGEIDDNWEARFAAFKKAQHAGASGSDDEDEYSEGADTIGRLPEFSVLGGKKRRKGTSDASGYSMTSSSMFRNEGLRALDERFDQIEKEYESDEEDDPEEDDNDAPQLLTSREDFDKLMDEFLEKFEISGGKMKPSLPGTGAEKLEALRLAMGQDSRVRERGSDESDDSNDDDIFAAWAKEDKKDRWDVETVLTTHTNLENHPRLIRARESKPVPRIRLDPRTGLPSVVGSPAVNAPKGQHRIQSPIDEIIPARTTITRPRAETKEEKKARKDAVKASRQTRRVEKKVVKEQFSAAIKQQTRIIGDKQVRTRKL